MRGKKLAGLLFLEVYSFITMNTGASAAEIESDSFVPQELKTWTNGGTVVQEQRDMGDYEISLDTSGLKKGNYSAYLFENKKRNLQRYGALEFHLDIPNTAPLKINMSLQPKNEASQVRKEGSFSAWMREGESHWETVRIINGSLEIPASFSGRLYMLFSSIIFLFYFFPLVLLLNFLFRLSRTLQNISLLIFSLIFYAWGEPSFVIIMLCSILINYICGLLIYKNRNHKMWSKIILIVMVAGNLGNLFAFK
ncbi:hypothetical protein J9303_20505 [Bacillaceae bacterium Marseille-Q3522]|nr:hypothetical protein [Bacillaceae bacterium Marseille-Q3522]